MRRTRCRRVPCSLGPALACRRGTSAAIYGWQARLYRWTPRRRDQQPQPDVGGGHGVARPTQRKAVRRRPPADGRLGTMSRHPITHGPTTPAATGACLDLASQHPSPQPRCAWRRGEHCCPLVVPAASCTKQPFSGTACMSTVWAHPAMGHRIAVLQAEAATHAWPWYARR